MRNSFNKSKSLTEEVNRFNFLSGRMPIETYNFLIESKQTEAQGINILTKANIENPENIIKQFSAGDKSKNAKNIPYMAIIYANGYKDINTILSVFNEYNDLEVLRRIKPIQIVGNALKIGGKTFTDFIKFSEYVHGEKTKYLNQKKLVENMNNSKQSISQLGPITILIPMKEMTLGSVFNMLKVV